MAQTSCSFYNGTMVVMLLAIHIGGIYFEMRGTDGERDFIAQGQPWATASISPSPSVAPFLGANKHGSDWPDSFCWFLLWALFVANLVLKPRGDGLWTCYNASMIILTIVIIAVGMGFGVLRKSNKFSDWHILFAAVEICALGTQDGLFLIHLFTTADADAKSAKSDHEEQATS